MKSLFSSRDLNVEVGGLNREKNGRSTEKGDVMKTIVTFFLLVLFAQSSVSGQEQNSTDLSTLRGMNVNEVAQTLSMAPPESLPFETSPVNEPMLPVLGHRLNTSIKIAEVDSGRFCYGPLLFEEQALERHGQTGRRPLLRSSWIFFSRGALLPARILRFGR